MPRNPIPPLIEPQPLAARPLRLYRALTSTSGVVYLVWWKLVELSLPGSFNPLGSRLAIVSFCWAVFAASFFSKWVERDLRKWFYVCVWLITLHYFYLFHGNQADINWVIGSYITVVAICACLQTESALLSYSAWVVALSILLSFQNPMLLSTVFLPGIVTILAMAYVGLRTRIRLLEQRFETSQWFQNLFHAVFEGIVVHKEGDVITSNESFAAIFGYSVAEVTGMKIADFVLPESRELTLKKIEQMSEEPYEVAGRKKDGSLVPIEIRAKKHTARGVRLRLAAVSDLTARKKSEQDRVLYEASQKAVQMRDEFLSIASHELKTPLTNIKIQTQMAMRGFKKGDSSALEPERMKKFIEQTDRQADRLTRLVEEMLDVSRIVSGKLKIDLEKFDLADLVREVASNFEASLEQAGSRLEIETPNPAQIQADRFRMEQVVSNLISNAIKYGNGKPIRIRIEQQPSETRLIVEDHGGGILQEDHERIFQRFERAISSKKISGLGLGLYITKYIVDAHGGRVEVASQPHQGARFTVTLPS